MADFNHLTVADPSSAMALNSSSNQLTTPSSSTGPNLANRNLIRGNSVATLNQIYQHQNSIPIRNRILNTAKSLQHPSVDAPDPVCGASLGPMEQQQHLTIQAAAYYQQNSNQPMNASSALNAYSNDNNNLQQQTANNNNNSAWSRISGLPAFANDTLTNLHQSIGNSSNEPAQVIPNHSMPIQIINVARRHKKQLQTSAESSYNSPLNCMMSGGQLIDNSPQQQQQQMPYATYGAQTTSEVHMRGMNHQYDQQQPRRACSATKLDATGTSLAAWSSDSSSCSSSCGGGGVGAGPSLRELSPMHHNNIINSGRVSSSSPNPLNYVVSQAQASRIQTSSRSPNLSRNSTLDVQQQVCSRSPSPSRQLPVANLTNQLSAETSPTHQQQSGSPRRRILPPQPQAQGCQQQQLVNSSSPNKGNESSPNNQLYREQQQVINQSTFSSGSEMVDPLLISSNNNGNNGSSLAKGITSSSYKKHRKLPQIPTELIVQQQQQMNAKLQQELSKWNGQQQQQQDQQRRALINKSNKSSLSSSSSEANSSNSPSAMNNNNNNNNNNTTTTTTNNNNNNNNAQTAVIHNLSNQQHKGAPLRAMTTTKQPTTLHHHHHLSGEQLRVQSFPMPSTGSNPLINKQTTTTTNVIPLINNNEQSIGNANSILIKHNLINNKFHQSSDSGENTSSPRSPITMSALQRNNYSSSYQPLPLSASAKPKLTTSAASSSSSGNSPAAMNSAGLISKSQHQQINSSSSTSGYFTFDQVTLAPMMNSQEFSQKHQILDNNNGSNFICYSPGGTRRLTDTSSASTTDALPPSTATTTITTTTTTTTSGNGTNSNNSARLNQACDNNPPAANQHNQNQLQADSCFDSINSNNNNSNDAAAGSDGAGNYSAVRGRRLSTCGSGLRANFLMNKQHAISEFTPPRSLESSTSRGSNDLPHIQPGIPMSNNASNGNNNNNRAATPVVHSSAEMLRASSAGGASGSNMQAQSSCQQLTVNTSAASLILSSDSINSPAGIGLIGSSCLNTNSLSNSQVANQYRSNSAQNIVMRNNSINQQHQPSYKSLSNRLTPVNGVSQEQQQQQQQQHYQQQQQQQRQRAAMIMKMGGSTGGVIGAASMGLQQASGYSYGSYLRCGASRPGYAAAGLPPRAASATESSSVQNSGPFLIGSAGDNSNSNVGLSHNTGLGMALGGLYLNEGAAGCLINQTAPHPMQAASVSSNSASTNMNFAGTGNVSLSSSGNNNNDNNNNNNNNIINSRQYHQHQQTTNQMQRANNAIEFQQSSGGKFPEAPAPVGPPGSTSTRNNHHQQQLDQTAPSADFCNGTSNANVIQLGNRRLGGSPSFGIASSVTNAISIDVYHCDEANSLNCESNNNNDNDPENATGIMARSNRTTTPMTSSTSPFHNQTHCSLSFEFEGAERQTNPLSTSIRRNLSHQQQHQQLQRTSLVPPQQRDRQPSNVSTNSMPAVSSFTNSNITDNIESLASVSAISSGQIEAACGAGSAGRVSSASVMTAASHHHQQQQQQNQQSANTQLHQQTTIPAAATTTTTTTRKFGAWAERIASSGKVSKENWPGKPGSQLAATNSKQSSNISKSYSSSSSTSSSDSTSSNSYLGDSRSEDDSSQTELKLNSYQMDAEFHRHKSREKNNNARKNSPSINNNGLVLRRTRKSDSKVGSDQISELETEHHQHLSSGGTSSSSSPTSSSYSSSTPSPSRASRPNQPTKYHHHHHHHHVGTSSSAGRANQTSGPKGYQGTGRVVHARRRKKGNANNNGRRRRRSGAHKQVAGEFSGGAKGNSQQQQQLESGSKQSSSITNNSYNSSDQLTLCDKLKLAERSASKLFRKVELSPQQQQHQVPSTNSAKLSSNINWPKKATELRAALEQEQEPQGEKGLFPLDNANKSQWNEKLAQRNSASAAGGPPGNRREACAGDHLMRGELENGQERGGLFSEQRAEEGELEKEADDLSLLLSSAERQLQLEREKLNAKSSANSLLMGAHNININNNNNNNAQSNKKQAFKDSKGAIDLNLKKSWILASVNNRNKSSLESKQANFVGASFSEASTTTATATEAKGGQGLQNLNQHQRGGHHASVRKTATSAARVFRRAITLKSFVRNFANREGSGEQATTNSRTETLLGGVCDVNDVDDDHNFNGWRRRRSSQKVLATNHVISGQKQQQQQQQHDSNKFPHLLSVATAENVSRARLSSDCLQSSSYQSSNNRQLQYKQERPSSATELGGLSQQQEEILTARAGSRAAIKLRAATFFSRKRRDSSGQKQQPSSNTSYNTSSEYDINNNNCIPSYNNNNNNITSTVKQKFDNNDNDTNSFLANNSKKQQQHYYSRSVSRSSCPNSDEKPKPPGSVQSDSIGLPITGSNANLANNNNNQATPTSPRLTVLASNAAACSLDSCLNPNQAATKTKQHGLNRMKSVITAVSKTLEPLKLMGLKQQTAAAGLGAANVANKSPEIISAATSSLTNYNDNFDDNNLTKITPTMSGRQR